MSKKITLEKPPVVSWRIRRVPCGFGWADHRLLRNGFLRLCTPDAMALYLLLILAADGNGMSFYGDRLLCSTLGLSGQRLESARDNLLHADLVAWHARRHYVPRAAASRLFDYPLRFACVCRRRSTRSWSCRPLRKEEHAMMLDCQTYHEVRRLKQVEHLSVAEIAEQYGVSDKTVRKWLKLPVPPEGIPGRKRTAVLDGHADLVMKLCREYGSSSGRIARRLQELGVSTSLRSVQRWLASHALEKDRKIFNQLSFEAGRRKRSAADSQIAAKRRP